MSRLFATADMGTLRSDVPLDEVPHQHDVMIGGQLDRQADRNILGKLRIRPFLERLDLVPKASEASAAHRPPIIFCNHSGALVGMANSSCSRSKGQLRGSPSSRSATT